MTTNVVPTASDTAARAPVAPAFIVGVTGHMDLGGEEAERVRRELGRLLRFLKHGQQGEAPPGSIDYAELLPDWGGLPNTPIVVLTSLAPGADTLASNAALAMEGDGVSVLAPLPFPHEVYREASTFVRRGAPDEENAARQDDYDRLLERVGVDRTFPVPLAENVERPPHESDDKLRADLEDPERRRRRYRAAGEWIAVNAHLLVAIWDEEKDSDTSCGTAAIVEARLRGASPGLLPSTAPLRRVDAGPVLHLATRRACAPKREPLARLLDPRDDASDAASLLSRVGANLDAFNASCREDAAREREELRKRLTYRCAVGEPRYFDDDLAACSPELHAGLTRLATLRRRSADAGGVLDPRSQGTWRTLFRLALAAAIVLHLFAHWHPRDGAHGVASSSAAQSQSDGEASPGAGTAGDAHGADGAHAGGHGEGTLTRPALGLLALFIAACGLLVFWLRAPSGDAERAHDSRALAEGLRAQFYWCLVGLGRCVSESYMERQRTELDWIRGAIRSTTAPYEHWREMFDALSPTEKLRAVRCTLVSWVEDQAKFFRDAAHKRHRALHFWHKIGGALAMAAVWTFAVVCVHSREPESMAWIEDRPWLLLLVFGLALALGAACSLWCRHDRAPRSDDERKPSLLERCARLLDDVAATRESHMGALAASARRQRTFINFLRIQPLAVGVGALALAVIGLATSAMPALPDVFDLAIVAGGSLLVCGALAIAWAEKNLHSEHSYQYTTMAALFRDATEELEGHVTRLEKNIAHPEEFNRVLRETRALIYELGREALDENAEWLILHRARPIEPVMPS